MTAPTAVRVTDDVLADVLTAVAVELRHDSAGHLLSDRGFRANLTQLAYHLASDSPCRDAALARLLPAVRLTAAELGAVWS